MTDEPTPNAGEPPSSWNLDDQAMRRLLSALFHVGSDAPTTEVDEEPATTDDDHRQTFGASGAELAATPPKELGEGARLGRFQLERELGRGGFGVVYLAFDERLGRRVALKTPRPDRVQNAALWRRFAREARLAAALDHPAIVPVLEAGVADGVAFIASAYQEGRSLSQWIGRAPGEFPPRLAAGIAEQLAAGLTHAHGRGVLHRDLKPGNVIMIGEPPSATAGFPSDASVQALITDFGLGSFGAGDAGATLTGLWMGSPPYMAPEQALADDQPIDVRTDVYALGAILYEMLTGRPIYPRRDLADLAIRLSRGEAPSRPRQLRRGIPRDLETICLKCLAHEPARRYASAAGLWDDLRRHLDGRPIAARRAPWPERLVRWARRRPSLAALAGVLIVGAATGAALVVRHNAELSASNTLLATVNQRLKREVRAADLASAHAKLTAGDAESAQWILARYFPKPGEPDRRGFAWRYLWGRATRDYSVHELTGPTWSRFGEPTNFDPDWWRRPFPFAWRHDAAGLSLGPAGPRLVNVAWSSLDPTNGPREIWGLTQRAIWDAPAPGGESRLTLAPDGRTLALADSAWRFDPAEGPPPLDRRPPTSAPATGPREVVRLPASNHASFSADGRTLAALMMLPDEKSCVPVVYDLASGRGVALDRLRRRRAFIGTPAHLSPYRLPVRLAVSPDGGRLALSLGDDSPLQVVDARDGRVIWSAKADAPDDDSVIMAMAFSPSGARLVSGGVDGRTRLWDAETGRELAPAPFVTNRVEAVGFYPDEGAVVAIAHRENRVRSWSIHPRVESPLVFDHGAEVWSMAFIPGSDLLATGGDDHLIELWNVARGARAATLRAHETMVTSLSTTPDGRLLASGDLDGRLWLWDPSKPEKPSRRLPDFPARVRQIAWSPDGQRLAIIGAAPLARIWDRRSDRSAEFAILHDIDAYAVVWSPDGAMLAIGGHDGLISLWGESRDAPLTVLDAGQRITRVAFAPDGETLVAGNNAGGLQLWRLDRLDDPPLTIRRNSQVGGIWALTFSPDGRVLAAGDDGGGIALWDPVTLRELCRIREHQSHKVRALAFSPDGRRLASADFKGKILIHSGAEMVDAPEAGSL